MNDNNAVSNDVHDIHTQPMTVLGRGQARIPRGGKIRAGIKVLSKQAAADPRARQIYEDGVRADDSFERIGALIEKALPDMRNPLVPKNVAWFTVRGCDFPNPEIAAQILDKYGEVREDGVLRLYRFPVIFPADDWQAVMPHELVTWSASEKRYWSEYSADGLVRHCMTHAPARMDKGGRRALRRFGARPTQARADNNGVCDPEQCGEFQNRQCNLSGSFLFYIPGIRSIDAFELRTNSFYAMSRAIERLKAIQFMRGGRVSGFLDERRTTFFITKKLLDVAHGDEHGKTVRSAHWIIELEAPVDVAALLVRHDDESALRLADRAAGILQGDGVVVEPADEAVPGDPAAMRAWNDTDDIAETAGWAEDAGEPEEAGKPVAGRDAGHRAATRRHERSGVAAGDDGAQFEAIRQLAVDMGIDAARFEAYTDQCWGGGWRRSAHGRQRALDELARHHNDPAGLADKIAAALDRLEVPGAR